MNWPIHPKQVKEIFSEADVCFQIYDPIDHRLIAQYEEARTKLRLTPCSTFKIPLCLMGFDSGILTSSSAPKWLYHESYPAVIDCHREDQTPLSWIKNSTVWYSQKLTTELGIDRFAGYLNRWNYGNQDITGNPNLNDGLTQSWLNSSLKISVEEQITFLAKFMRAELSVSDYAIEQTKDLLFVETLSNGYRLFGKTGSSGNVISNHHDLIKRKLGWFIGWIESDSRLYIFALNVLYDQSTEGFGGPKAKELTRQLFSRLTK